MKTFAITIYLIVPLIGALIALFSAFPVPSRQAPPQVVAEQQRRESNQVASRQQMARRDAAAQADEKAREEQQYQALVQRRDRWIEGCVRWQKDTGQLLGCPHPMPDAAY